MVMFEAHVVKHVKHMRTERMPGGHYALTYPESGSSHIWI